MSNDRIEEINATINLIQVMCETAGIGIVARDNKVVIVDSFDGKEYRLIKGKHDD